MVNEIMQADVSEKHERRNGIKKIFSFGLRCL
jgi:hypothetical protein